MMGIFSDLVEKVVEVFMNDFSIFGESFDACLKNLKLILERCEEKHLVLNWENYHFMVTQGLMLGHIVSFEGITEDKSKVELISSLLSPTSVKDIRSFLSHATFYKRFIRDFISIAWHLTSLLSKDTPFVWSEECEKEFSLLKSSLTLTPIM